MTSAIVLEKASWNTVKGSIIRINARVTPTILFVRYSSAVHL